MGAHRPLPPPAPLLTPATAGFGSGARAPAREFPTQNHHRGFWVGFTRAGARVSDPKAQWQAQPPPQPRGADDIAAATSAPDTLEVDRPPVDANIDNNLTVSVWPPGQDAGADDSLIGRFSEKTVSQVLQRNS